MQPQEGAASPRTLLIVATIAATVAAIGDACMIHVALGNAPLQASPPLGDALLFFGAVMGMAAIPLYRMGYIASRQPLRDAPGSDSGDRSLTIPATMVAVFGCATHGLTGLDIYLALTNGASTRTPGEALSSMAFPVWSGCVAAIACVAASLRMILAAWRSNLRARLLMGAMTPAPAAFTIALAATVCGSTGEYIGPMAPNLAHALYFGLLAIISGRRTPS